MRIAALDLGSNSFHLLVVEARLDGSFVPLAREKEMLRLGDLVARTGSIGERATRSAVEVIRRFKALADAQRVDEVVALGTAAIREALDGGAFVDTVRAETGVEIEVVDGVREARLIFTAIRSSVLIDPGPALAADLGGGSLELMVGDRTGLSFAASLHLGVGRLTAELVSSDPPGAKDRERLHQRIASELAPVLAEIADLKPTMLIGSSGTFVSLARMAAAMRDGSLPETVNQLTVSAKDLAAVSAKIFELTVDERAKLAGCDARRAELVPAGISVLGHLMAETGLSELTVSEWALREGIVLTAIGAHDPAELGSDPRALRRSSVLALCRRSNWRQRHARQAASLAIQLFDATADLHRLGPEERELLDLGALLHDIGEHVSRSGHDRHTAYLIENGGLRGFSPDEVRILAVLGRFHIRGTPKPSYEPFGALGPGDRSRAVTLTALLRIADALDATHSSVVETVARAGKPPPRHGRPDAVVLHVRARGDTELEEWMVRRKQELFERNFDTSLSLEVERIARGDLDLAHAEGAGLG
ncbi:MAG TPA: Ppx/GppA phosphatase family protein [Acidimicrobiales bacterium]|nr:Ppx/GppA phosphatase family protein [Acidimicrobiales bacterium]